MSEFLALSERVGIDIPKGNVDLLTSFITGVKFARWELEEYVAPLVEGKSEALARDHVRLPRPSSSPTLSLSGTDWANLSLHPHTATSVWKTSSLPMPLLPSPRATWPSLALTLVKKPSPASLTRLSPKRQRAVPPPLLPRPTTACWSAQVYTVSVFHSCYLTKVDKL